MSLYKRGEVWWTKFKVDGQCHRSTTRMTNKNLARDREREIINEIKSGQPPKPTPSVLSEFLRGSFLPYIEVNFRSKPKTRDYYVFGSRRLERGILAKLELDQINSEKISRFVHSLGEELSPSTINQALRTLRRALNIAAEWERIPKVPKFSLLPERRREQVLEPDEEAGYLRATEEPWTTIATIWIELGMRPGEIVRIEAQDLDWSTLEIHIRSGKTKAARRSLPMTGNVYKVLSGHLEKLGWPETGPIFRSRMDPFRHASEKRIVDWHERTLKRLFREKMADRVTIEIYLSRAPEPWRTIFILREETGLRTADIVKIRHHDLRLSRRELIRGETKIELTKPALSALKNYLVGRTKGEWLFPSRSGLEHVSRKRARDWHVQTLKRMPGSFVPYVMRHTALTRLANSEGVSLTTVMAAAGHSSLVVTQRYVHPQKGDIRKAFELKTGERIGDARRRELLKPMEGGFKGGTKRGTMAGMPGDIASDQED